jgi:hypothetical protein
MPATGNSPLWPLPNSSIILLQGNWILFRVSEFRNHNDFQSMLVYLFLILIKIYFISFVPNNWMHHKGTW